ncbi:hypothetical protein P7C70_g3701, partial [Phenoliferia sp. Uapishka_3]
MTVDPKRSRIFTLEDVATHKTSKDCWIVHDNKIYDVTKFLYDHPGGDDYILSRAGTDITSSMADPSEHIHSASAYEMLREFQVGVVGAEEHLLNPDYVYKEEDAEEQTDTNEDFSRNHFIDLRKPLLMQVLRSNYSKSFYLQQVHQPRHLPGPARLFGPWNQTSDSASPASSDLQSLLEESNLVGHFGTLWRVGLASQATIWVCPPRMRAVLTGSTKLHSTFRIRVRCVAQFKCVCDPPFDQQWEIRYSNSRSRPYFYSNATKESVWDKPADLTDDDILTLKGAEHFAQPAPPPGKVRASHLLVKHKDSRRPGSWKTPKITITKEEAIEQLKAHQKALLDAPDLRKAFAELATKESDCSSARDGGDLGKLRPEPWRLFGATRRARVMCRGADSRSLTCQVGSGPSKCRSHLRTQGYFVAWLSPIGVFHALVILLIFCILYPPLRSFILPPPSSLPIPLPSSTNSDDDSDVAEPPDDPFVAQLTPEQREEMLARDFTEGMSELVALGTTGQSSEDGESDMGGTEGETDEDELLAEPAVDSRRLGLRARARELRRRKNGKAKKGTRRSRLEKIGIPFMQTSGKLADLWEKWGNALSPCEPFPPDVARIRLVRYLLPVPVAGFLFSPGTLVSAVSFLVGVAFFGEPVFHIVAEILDARMPGWREKWRDRHTMLDSAPTDLQVTIRLLREAERSRSPLRPPPPLPKRSRSLVSIKVDPPPDPSTAGETPSSSSASSMRRPSIEVIETTDSPEPIEILEDSPLASASSRFKAPFFARSRSFLGSGDDGPENGVFHRGWEKVAKKATDRVRAASTKFDFSEKLKQRELQKEEESISNFFAHRGGIPGHLILIPPSLLPKTQSPWILSFVRVASFPTANSTSSPAKSFTNLSVPISSIIELKKVSGLGWKGKMAYELLLTPDPSSNTTITADMDERSGDAAENIEKAAKVNSNADTGLMAKKRAARRKFLLMTGINFSTFWVLGVWIFGTTYKDEEHVHHIKMSVADFDGGPVGASLLASVATYNGLSTYPTFHIANSPSQTPKSLEHEAFIGHTWGTIYAPEGASDRFAAALNQSAGAYDSTAAIYYAGNQVRYITLPRTRPSTNRYNGGSNIREQHGRANLVECDSVDSGSSSVALKSHLVDVS